MYLVVLMYLLLMIVTILCVGFVIVGKKPALMSVCVCVSVVCVCARARVCETNSLLIYFLIIDLYLI